MHQLTQTISDIELQVNSHVTLQGDLSEDNPKWGATKEYVEKQIDFFFKKEDGTSEGTESGGVYRFYLPLENITDLEKVLSAIFHKNVKLDFTNSIIFDEVLDNVYTFVITNDSMNSYLNIYINDNITYIISYATWASHYENFSVVSNKLNQSTE